MAGFPGLKIAKPVPMGRMRSRQTLITPYIVSSFFNVALQATFAIDGIGAKKYSPSDLQLTRAKRRCTRYKVESSEDCVY